MHLAVNILFDTVLHDLVIKREVMVGSRIVRIYGGILGGIISYEALQGSALGVANN